MKYKKQPCLHNHNVGSYSYSIYIITSYDFFIKEYAQFMDLNYLMNYICPLFILLYFLS